ncbi:hypothetical protein KKF34_18355 [Myxococcota bacterium]|nr:hypothetical protein [Myxococcota bacterium]MBU1381589.1 hypothetical protein [Myxococcota bacterium]MBU1498847.1 hypothetical protein [Myxococcota bacterium]
MKKMLHMGWLVALMTYSTMVSACPKLNQQKLREYKMKVTEKLEAYEYNDALKLVTDSNKFATAECKTNEHAMALLFFKGVAEFGNKSFKESKATFRQLFVLKLDYPINENVSTPKLKAFYNAVLAEYKNELKNKAETKAKIKALEDATGMPEEPKENPAVPIEHSPRTKGFRGRPITVFCRVKDEIKAVSVTAFVDAEGKGNFKEFQMKKVGIRRFVLTLSGKETSTPVLKYYLMAFNAAKKPAAASGNSANPHSVPLSIADEKDGSETADKKPKVDDKKVVIKDPGLGDKKPKESKQIEDDDEKHVKPNVIVDEPDEIKKAKAAAKAHTPFHMTPNPVLYLGVGFGVGLGYISGESEALKSPLEGGFGMALTSQVELGYMMDKYNAFTVLFQMGFSKTSTNIPGLDQFTSNDFLFKSSYRNDMRFIARYKRLSHPERIATTQFSWRYFWGIGMGGGNIRHQAPAESNSVTYDDTHYSSGIMLNLHGGAMMCLTAACTINLQLEADYTAAFSMAGNSIPAHLDFVFGLGFIF